MGHEQVLSERLVQSLQAAPGHSPSAAYENMRMCEHLAGTGVRVLRTWLPSAILGSRESVQFGDCLHPRVRGSTVTMWNAMLLFEMRVAEREAAGSSGVAAARADDGQAIHADPSAANATSRSFLQLAAQIIRMIQQPAGAGSREGNCKPLRSGTSVTAGQVSDQLEPLKQQPVCAPGSHS